jgi:hypothetical protein
MELSPFLNLLPNHPYPTTNKLLTYKPRKEVLSLSHTERKIERETERGRRRKKNQARQSQILDRQEQWGSLIREEPPLGFVCLHAFFFLVFIEHFSLCFSFTLSLLFVKVVRRKQSTITPFD